MSDLANISVHIATDGRTWIANTATAPYFCLEAVSEKDALAMAARALEFFNMAATRPAKTARGETFTPQFRYRSKITARELAIVFW